MSHQPIVPRARLGVIIPSSNRMAEPNFQAYAPDGVVPHFARVRMSGPHRGALQSHLHDIGEAAAMLGDAKCDVILLQCTGTSMSGGFGAEKTIAEAITRASGRPGITTATCLMSALQTLGARRLVFLSENDEAGYEDKRRFMVDAGYDILGGRGAGLRSDQSCVTPPEFWADLAREYRNDAADAYFISCANIRAIDAIEALEAEFDRPVLTSNQVALWRVVRMAGIDDDIAGLGRLGRLKVADAIAA